MDPATQNVTLLLIELTKGNKEAASKLIPLVYDELHRLARRHMRRERADRRNSSRAECHSSNMLHDLL